MRIYSEKCKRHTSNLFPKKLVLISNNKIKGKSRMIFNMMKFNMI